MDTPTHTPTHTPAIVRAEIGGGFLIVFPTIPSTPNHRTAHTYPLCWSSHDGHSCIEHGYYLKYTKPVSDEVAQATLRKYLEHHDVANAVVAKAWEPEHDRRREDEAWKISMRKAVDRMPAK
jgi:hypothetical protein